MIKQEEILAYEDARRKIQRAESRLSLAKAQFKDGERKLLARLVDGETVEKGRARIWMEKMFKRASISWKSVVQELKGLAFVEKMIQDAKREEYDVLKVEIGE